MLVRTVLSGIAMWSRYQPDRGFAFNSWLVEDAQGAFVVDPLEPDEVVLAAAREARVHTVVITNRDHQRASAAFVDALGCTVAAPDADAGMLDVRVDRRLADGERIGDWRVVVLEGFKTPGESVLVNVERAIAISGDAFWGVPAGGLQFMPADKLADRGRAALSARRIREFPLDALLVGDGTPIFRDAQRILSDCIDAFDAPVLVRRVNVDELTYPSMDEPPPFGGSYADAGFHLGAERLGYRITKLARGEVFCPLHWHTAEEELYYVIAGTPTVGTPRGAYVARPGDLIAFGCNAAGAHRLENRHDEIAVVLMVANTDSGDVCYYPDSDKLLVEATGTLVRASPPLDYYDGEVEEGRS